MNGKTAKMLRGAAGRPQGYITTYEQLQLHHVAQVPVFETHERVIWEWFAPARRYFARAVTKIRFNPDGKTPFRPLLTEEKDEATGIVSVVPRVDIIPVTKPVRLAKGSPRAVYQEIKRVHKTIGLDAAFKRLHAEVTT